MNPNPSVEIIIHRIALPRLGSPTNRNSNPSSKYPNHRKPNSRMGSHRSPNPSSKYPTNRNPKVGRSTYRNHNPSSTHPTHCNSNLRAGRLTHGNPNPSHKNPNHRPGSSTLGTPILAPTHRHPNSRIGSHTQRKLNDMVGNPIYRNPSPMAEISTHSNLNPSSK